MPVKVCYIYNCISEHIFRTWQTDWNLFYQGTMIGGGGQDVPAGVSWPPPQECILKFFAKEFVLPVKGCFVLIDVYNYSFIWQNPGKLLNHQIVIGGWLQDTPAGVSWPPPKTAFWKFEEFLFSIPIKVCFIYNCIFQSIFLGFDIPMEIYFIRGQW